MLFIASLSRWTILFLSALIYAAPIFPFFCLENILFLGSFKKKARFLT